MSSKIIVMVIVSLYLSFAQECCGADRVEVQGNAQVKVSPDFAMVEVGVIAERSTTHKALYLLNNIIMLFHETIVAHGMSQKDYSYSSVKIVPIYAFDGASNILIGYRCSMTWFVKVRDILYDASPIGFLLEDLRQNDGLTIKGVSFHIQNSTQGIKQARKSAFFNAKKIAEEYAQKNNRKVGKAISISSVGRKSVQPFIVKPISFISGDFETRIYVKEVTITENVTVQFQLIV